MSADHSKQSKINILSRFIDLLQSFMGSVAYFFRSNIDGLRTIWQHWVKTPLSDTGTVLSVLMAFLSGLILYKAKNKNLGKTFDFFYSMLQATLALLTLAASFATGTVLAIAISAMVLNIAYSLGSFVYSFYKYRSYAKETTVENLNMLHAYKNAMLRYAAGFIISLVVLTSFLVVSVFFPFVAAAVSLSIGLATSIMLLGLGIYSVYSFFHSSKCQSKKQENTEISEMPKREKLSSAVIDNNSRIFSNIYKENTFEYYQVNEFLTQLTGDLDKDRKTLILEAYKGILQLQREIFKDRARGGAFWDQEPKRLAKLDFYKKSLVLLLPTSPAQASLYLSKIDGLGKPDIISLELMYKSNYKLIKGNLIEKTGDKLGEYYSKQQLKLFLSTLETRTHQSFFKNRGKVEIFIQTLEIYFEKLAQCAKAQEETICVTSPVWASISP